MVGMRLFLLFFFLFDYDDEQQSVPKTERNGFIILSSLKLVPNSAFTILSYDERSELQANADEF
jgi:hypothetical protein